MDDPPAPSAEDVIRFLRGLRRYRATLPEPAQLLLDSLVTTGLGRTPDQPHPDETRVLWGAYDDSSRGRGTLRWEATPWGWEYHDRWLF